MKREAQRYQVGGFATCRNSKLSVVGKLETSAPTVPTVPTATTIYMLHRGKRYAHSSVMRIERTPCDVTAPRPCLQWKREAQRNQVGGLATFRNSELSIVGKLQTSAATVLTTTTIYMLHRGRRDAHGTVMTNKSTPCEVTAPRHCLQHKRKAQRNQVGGLATCRNFKLRYCWQTSNKCTHCAQQQQFTCCIVAGDMMPKAYS